MKKYLSEKDRYLAKDIKEAFKRADRYRLVELDSAAKEKYAAIQRKLMEAQQLLQGI